MRNLKKEQGITLVALVITIVVLLILAGVVLASLTGENNIIEKAKYSKELTEMKIDQEQIELWIDEETIENRESVSIEKDQEITTPNGTKFKVIKDEDGQLYFCKLENGKLTDKKYAVKDFNLKSNSSSVQLIYNKFYSGEVENVGTFKLGFVQNFPIGIRESGYGRSYTMYNNNDGIITMGFGTGTLIDGGNSIQISSGAVESELKITNETAALSFSKENKYGGIFYNGIYNNGDEYVGIFLNPDENSSTDYYLMVHRLNSRKANEY